MCGIFTLLNYGNVPKDVAPLNHKELERIFSFIDARGPDFKSEPITIKLNLTSSERAQLNFKASVLHLRGDDICRQPVVDSHSNVLLFNGEIYHLATNNSNITQSITNRSVPDAQSDTQHLMLLLSQALDQQEILAVLGSIIGPFALIYWHQSTTTLYFGRDIFGRRSLCIYDDPVKKTLIISSVAPLSSLKWKEVAASGIHQIELNCSNNHNGIRLLHTINLWDLDRLFPRTTKCDNGNFFQYGQSGIHINYSKIKTPLTNKLNSDAHSSSCLYSEGFQEDPEPGEEEKNLLLEFDRILQLSLSRRITLNKQLICQDCKAAGLFITSKCIHNSVAVAFSGGIDSTVLALAASKHIPDHQPIDLLNVAFGPNAPDRLTAKAAFLELIRLKPNRQWNLICIDVELKDLERDRRDRIKYLIAPLKTVIDDSIGCALWYISRGMGRRFSSLLAEDCTDLDKLNETLEEHIKFKPNKGSLYRCPARTLIVGMGIDEQLGGYSTHRACWLQCGTVGLYNEISFQMRRLPTRNLGRDDRVGGDHGRDVKIPFLDESLVDFFNDLPVHYKMNLCLAAGFGDKIILRRYAKYLLGLTNSSNNVKRAMQFGTRIAKLECKKEKGHENCARLA